MSDGSQQQAGTVLQLMSGLCCCKAYCLKAILPLSLLPLGNMRQSRLVHAYGAPGPLADLCTSTTDFYKVAGLPLHGLWLC